ncbi:MAG: signal peptidase I [Patescibacteria group bacterium]|nr:signal peptidase I [Patescibacteria group bacterium]
MKSEDKKKIKNGLIFIADIALNVAILFVLVFSIREFFVAPFQIFGPSMCDTLNNYDEECQDGYGEYIILKKWHYLFNEPERYDIVVFHPPHKEDTFYIKRIIGMPGEEVNIRDGNIFIDGKNLEEEYLNEENHGATKAFVKTRFVVPNNSYFLLGDNRTQSTDSRTCFENEKFGCEKDKATSFITKENIEGKAWIVLWPFEYSRVIKTPSP